MTTVDDTILEIKFNAVPDHYTGQWDGQNSDFARLKVSNLFILPNLPLLSVKFHDF